MSARKVDRGDPETACPVEQGPDGVWRVRGYEAGRAALRSTDTRQAGLGIETIEKLPAKIRRPVLYRDGPEHRGHRRRTARYFTARRVDEHYRDLMVRIAEEQLDRLRRDGTAHLSELSFALAIDVTKAVIGLTDSRPGTARRLERFFPEKFGKPGFTSFSGVYWFFRQNFSWLAVYFGDVRPAVRVRRRESRDDLISHLIEEGCSNSEILGECLTFAAAGMVTTREFINVAAWHLFSDEGLRERYLAAEEPARFAILHELLRLEPVIGNLKRRTTAPVELPGADGPVVIPAGALIDVAVTAANVDPHAVGDAPLAVCPARPLAEGTSTAGLSFGDGPHKCPGAHVAIQESDIFLHRLFSIGNLRMQTPPRVSINEEISGYELRGMVVTLDR
ncbi:cytochrome P450 [Allocatelliglobosispora scoriae]|uniref:Cytochrome P450 n=1 Tax=Allocatelliglobosispora scoriae TaxID=643052 RepID=A0A841BLY5_9ACTN|nr:cytochrome P450 [Allocatelliglobosispora scoriae]MBB5868266.1 cytochrome P450 [Allocatelliglobosispora scoriae]